MYSTMCRERVLARVEHFLLVQEMAMEVGGWRGRVGGGGGDGEEGEGGGGDGGEGEG